MDTSRDRPKDNNGKFPFEGELDCDELFEELDAVEEGKLEQQIQELAKLVDSNTYAMAQGDLEKGSEANVTEDGGNNTMELDYDELFKELDDDNTSEVEQGNLESLIQKLADGNTSAVAQGELPKHVVPSIIIKDHVGVEVFNTNVTFFSLDSVNSIRMKLGELAGGPVAGPEYVLPVHEELLSEQAKQIVGILAPSPSFAPASSFFGGSSAGTLPLGSGSRRLMNGDPYGGSTFLPVDIPRSLSPVPAIDFETGRSSAAHPTPSVTRTFRTQCPAPTIQIKVFVGGRPAHPQHRYTFHVDPDAQVCVLRQLLANKPNVAYLPQQYLFTFLRSKLDERMSFRDNEILSVKDPKIDVVDYTYPKQQEFDDAFDRGNEVGQKCAVDYIDQFTTYEIFKGKDALIRWVPEQGKLNNMVIVMKMSDLGGEGKIVSRPRLTLACERNSTNPPHKCVVAYSQRSEEIGHTKKQSRSEQLVPPKKSWVERFNMWYEEQDDDKKRQLEMKIEELMNPGTISLNDPKEKIKTKGRPCKVDSSTWCLPSAFEITKAKLAQSGFDCQTPVTSTVANVSTISQTKKKQKENVTTPSKKKQKENVIALPKKRQKMNLAATSAIVNAKVVFDQLSCDIQTTESNILPRRKQFKTCMCREEFPEAIRTYITGQTDVKSDGNCGYRVISVALGIDNGWHDGWRKVRRDLLYQLHQMPFLFQECFVENDSYAEIERALDYFEDGFAPAYSWLIMPDMGHVIATCYNIVLILLSKKQCITFLPHSLESSSQSSDTNLSEVAIGYLGEHHHFIQVHLCEDHPMPPVSTMWHKKSQMSNDIKVKNLYSKYQGRVDQFKQLRGLENVATNDIVDLEDE